MSQSAFFTIVAILYVLLGIGHVVAPAEFLGGFGMNVELSGRMAARVVGAATIALGIIYWACRDAGPSRLFSAVLYGSIVEKAIIFCIALYAVQTGIFNSSGWVLVIMQIVLGAGFAYFAFGKR